VDDDLEVGLVVPIPVPIPVALHEAVRALGEFRGDVDLRWKGELHYIDKRSQVLVQGDVNGEGKPNFEILAKVGALEEQDGRRMSQWVFLSPRHFSNS